MFTGHKISYTTAVTRRLVAKFEELSYLLKPKKCPGYPS